LIKYRSRSLDQVKGMLQVIPATGALLFVGALALVGTPPFNIFVSKFFIISTGLGTGHLWLMILCLLLLTVVLTTFYRVLASTLFGEKPDGVGKGEANWLTLVPGAAFILLILTLGLYIPPQLMALLNGASGLMLTGSPLQQASSLTVKDFWLPLARLVP
jgi:hydrogenase-4 component F